MDFTFVSYVQVVAACAVGVWAGPGIIAPREVLTRAGGRALASRTIGPGGKRRGDMDFSALEVIA